MERSFSHLLRTSRLATFDKNIKQIYTTSGKSKRIGDWGLKRNLPTVLRTHFVNIEQLDTAEHQTPFNSAVSDYLFIQRWKENFPRSRPPQPQPINIQKDLAALTEAEFKKVLDAARERRSEWKEELATNRRRRDDHLSFMNIQSRHSRPSPAVDTATSQAHAAGLPAPTSSSSSSPKAISRPKVGPTYGFFEPSSPTIVQGRSLGRTKSMQIIGVSGVAAGLSANQTPHLYNAPKTLQSYYVYKAEFDGDNRPNVQLGLTNPGSSSWLSGSNLGKGELYSYSASRLPQGASSSSSTLNGKSNAGDGRNAISRVQDLLENRDKPTTRA
ncbi:hypothetical protein BGZ94_002693 [Podila epigama]|nr:hypothetical protein BGZ94_002693 [Podila epigama]